MNVWCSDCSSPVPLAFDGQDECPECGSCCITDVALIPDLNA